MVTNLADTLPPIAPSSLLLITSTLGAPATWLLNAYVAETLRPHAQNSKGRGVVLVSFVNDNCFFREGLRRGTGIDTQQYEKMGKLRVIDGLSGLFENTYLPSTSGTGPLPGKHVTNTPIMSRTVPGRGQPPAQSRPIATSRSPPSSIPTSDSASEKLHIDLSPDGTLTSSTLRSLATTISAALKSLTNSNDDKPLLVIENPDFLLSATSLPAHELWSFLLDLREISHSLLLTLAADIPILTPAISLSTNLFHGQAPPPLGMGQNPRLEVEHSAFVGMAVHGAECVVGLRLLDTGVAKDVSGVMRITRGGDAGFGGESVEEGDREKELLYYVGDGGGGVEIFNRGQVRG